MAPLLEVHLSSRQVFPVALQAEQALHTPGWAKVTCRIDGQLDPTSLIGEAARVDVDGSRVFAGIVREVDVAYGSCVLTITPRIARLDHTQDYRVHVNETALKSAIGIFDEHGLSHEERVARVLPALPQNVQGHETDLDFVSRVLADEGITWFVAHGEEDRLVLFDRHSACDPIAGNATLPFAEDTGLLGPEHVYQARLARKLVSTKVTLRDRDVDRPTMDLRKVRGDGAHAVFEPMAGYHDPHIGEELAAVRLEERQRDRLVLHAASNCARLAVGHTFHLQGAEHEGLNRQWLITSTAHRVDARTQGTAGQRSCVVEITALPADAAYRPARIPPPRLGISTSTITGPKGQEIHTDKLGRSNLLLRWDRRRSADETSSRVVRSLQPQTTGAVFLPRMGWECLVAHEGASANVPMILGRLDHGAATPAESLPHKKVRSALGSRTTPGGGSFNGIMTDDTAGNEGMNLTASSDFHDKTTTDRSSTVTATDTWVIGATHTENTKLAKSVLVKGAQTVSIAGSRTFNANAVTTIDTASETVVIGGVRMFKVGGDYSTKCSVLTRVVAGAMVETAVEAHNRHVTGAATIGIAGSWNEVGAMSAVGVLGAHARHSASWNIKTPQYSQEASTITEVMSSNTVSANGIGLDAKGSVSITVSGDFSMNAGGDVVFKGDAEVMVSAGGARIQVKPGSIDITGDFNSRVDIVVTGKDASE
jgi:type VI secretion system secreted protein VgrG